MKPPFVFLLRRHFPVEVHRVFFGGAPLEERCCTPPRKTVSGENNLSDSVMPRWGTLATIEVYRFLVKMFSE